MMEIDTTPRRRTNADLNEAVALLDEALQAIVDASGYTDRSRLKPMRFIEPDWVPSTLEGLAAFVEEFAEQIAERVE